MKQFNYQKYKTWKIKKGPKICPFFKKFLQNYSAESTEATVSLSDDSDVITVDSEVVSEASADLSLPPQAKTLEDIIKTHAKNKFFILSPCKDNSSISINCTQYMAECFTINRQ